MICSNVTEPTSVARAENSSSVKASGAPVFWASRYTSMRRMLCTLLSGALRRGAGQLRITSFPCCAPESNSVRCCTRSTGGRGGRRFPQPPKIIVAIRKAQRPRALLRFIRFVCLLCLLGLENITTEILILHSLGQHSGNVRGIDPLVLRIEIGTFKTDLLQQLLHDRL